MWLRRLAVAASGAIAVFLLWGGYAVWTLEGDEAGLMVIAYFGVIILALMVGWPLLVVAIALSLPERLRINLKVTWVAAVLCFAPSLLSVGEWTRLLERLITGEFRSVKWMVIDAMTLAFPTLAALGVLRIALNRRKRRTSFSSP
jgi:hypothetical protein